MNYNQLISLKKNISTDYINYYQNKGYTKMPALPLD